MGAKGFVYASARVTLMEVSKFDGADLFLGHRVTRYRNDGSVESDEDVYNLRVFGAKRSELEALAKRAGLDPAVDVRGR